MTILKCSATTCAYNEDMLCSRGEINVMGDSAKSSEETSCGSFREKSQGAMNSAKTAVDVRPSRLTAKPTTVPITKTVNVLQLLLM